MREILFRGKRADNNEWVEGYYSRDLGLVIVPPQGSFLGKPYIVIPSTVGQYTGLRDKDGTRIFEGNILERRHPSLTHSHLMKVIFDTENACFSAVDIGGKYATFIRYYLNNGYETKVVGNIHDNPEMVEGDRNEQRI